MKSSHHTDRRRTVMDYTILFVDNTFYALAYSLISPATVMPLLLTQLGASNLIIGLLPALANVGVMVTSVVVSPLVEPLQSKKRWLVCSGLIGRSLITAIGPSALILGTSNPQLLIWIVMCIWTIFNISTGAAVPAWLSILTKCVPTDSRARLLGWAAAASGVLGMLAAALTGAILTSVPFPRNFAILFFASGIIFTSSFLPYVWIHEKPDDGAPQRRPLCEYIRAAGTLARRQPSFIWLLVAMSSVSFALMASAFYSTYAVRNLAATANNVAAFTGITVGASVIASPMLGRLADAFGHKRVLIITSVSLAGAAGLAMASGSVNGIYLVLLLASIGSCGLNLSQNLLITEFAHTQQQMLMYIALSNLVIAPARILAPLIGGAVFDSHGFNATCWIALAAGVASALVLALLVVDPRKKKFTDAFIDA